MSSPHVSHFLRRALTVHAQKLTEQVKELTARVHELESALAQVHPDDPALHGQASGEDMFEKGLDNVSNVIGSLTIGSDGQAKYHGGSAASEYAQTILTFDMSEEREDGRPKPMDLPNEVVELMHAFPFGLESCAYSKDVFAQYFPGKDRALSLAALFYEHCAWNHDPISKDDFINNILDPLYKHEGLDKIHPHRLAVFFVLLAIGASYVDENHLPKHCRTKVLHDVARAAFSVVPLWQQATTATVQALFLFLQYVYITDRQCSDKRWLLGGLCTRVAQTIGLHRDDSRWNLDAEEHQRRRRLFWEIYSLDSWTSMITGRPPSLNLQHTDCRFPDDLEPVPVLSGEYEFGYHAWKFRYSASCLSLSNGYIFSTRPAEYNALLILDAKIRKFPLVSHLRAPTDTTDSSSWSSNPRQALQQYSALCERESNLLNIHRNYFIHALRQESSNPLRHKYGPSVLATYRSATRLINGLKGMTSVHPEAAERCYFFWSNVFSACFSLGVMVVESPKCSLSENAMRIVQQTIPFYKEGSKNCRPVLTVLMLERLLERASESMNDLKSPSSVEETPTAEILDMAAILEGHGVSSAETSEGSNASVTPSERTMANSEALMEYYNEITRPPPADMSVLDFDMEAPLALPSSSPPSNILYNNTMGQLGQPDGAPKEPQGSTSNATSMSAQGIVHSESSLRQTLLENNSSLFSHSSMPYHSSTLTGFVPQPMPANDSALLQDDIWRSFFREFGFEGGLGQ